MLLTETCSCLRLYGIYKYAVPLCLPNKTKLGTWRSVCIGSRNTALAFAAAQTLVYGSELGFLGPHWQLSSNTWTDWTSWKKGVFFIYFLLVCFHEKNKTSKAVGKTGQYWCLWNLLMLRIAHLKRRQVQIFCRALCIYCMSGKPYFLIFQKITVRVTDIGTTKINLF